ncbi:MAG TPA: hypothetical protein VK509_04055 [Polyangiales bacterium]|nr:hypothetical protein [Polyangiales bacterium]
MRRRLQNASACALLLALAGCGQQAGDDYRGEPLLRMRGQATVSALTGGQAIVPALCFFNADNPDPPAWDPGKLPADVRAGQDLGLPGGPIPLPLHVEPSATHVLDVESNGQFPAQFDIDVYQPPPSAALSLGFGEGEPRWASGRVCAVTDPHPAVTFSVVTGGSVVEGQDGHYRKRMILASQTSDRFYVEDYDCPTGETALADCAKTVRGDASLQYGSWSEFVVGASSDLEVVYLAEDAPAGSYTAWGLGAEDGLTAGYHLYAQRPPEEGEAMATCAGSVWPDALVEIKAQYEARIKQEFGDFQSLDMFPTINTPDGRSLQRVPDDVLRGGNAIAARLQMERCEFRPRAELEAGIPTLAIELGASGISQVTATQWFHL